MIRRTLATVFLFAAAAAGFAQAPRTITATSITLRGEPKYKAGFRNFDYVNPAAPKGGSITFHAIGTYDNFHRYALRGSSAAATDSLYDTLMTGSDDEVGTLYPLLAERVEYAEDYSFITFSINPAARSHSGRALTAEDVAYSFNTFYTKGVPQFRTRYEGVTVRVLDARRVRFDLPRPGDKELMMALASLKVFSKAFWEGKDFSEPLTVPPEGTGPYRISDYRMGQYVVYERVKNYWAAELPVNRGRHNFDTLRYDYYRDDTVAFQAFKAGEYDFRHENVAANWATQYSGPLFDSGRIVKEEVPHEIPQGMQAFVFNIDRPVFSDRRVRKALSLALDFEWMNRNLFYGQYERTRSYFQNTEYAASALPSAEELKILEPIRTRVPPEVFTTVYQPPKTDGTGNLRTQIRDALAIFKDAGWELRGGKLVNVRTGTPLEFELLIYSPTIERIAIPFQESLRRFGVEMRIRMVDTTQYINRLRERDFDMVYEGYNPYAYPSSGLNYEWHSAYIDSTWNMAGVKDSAVDYLVEGIVAAQEDERALLAWGRALDRVLTWNHFGIPQWHISKFRLAYNSKLAKPQVRPKYDIGVDTWWVK